MVRSRWLGPLFGFLACTALLVGQQPTPTVTPAPTERVLTVKEPDQPAQQYKVMKSAKQADGSTLHQVQSLSTGELLSLTESTAPDGSVSYFLVKPEPPAAPPPAVKSALPFPDAAPTPLVKKPTGPQAPATTATSPGTSAHMPQTTRTAGQAAAGKQPVVWPAAFVGTATPPPPVMAPVDVSRQTVAVPPAPESSASTGTTNPPPPVMVPSDVSRQTVTVPPAPEKPASTGTTTPPPPVMVPSDVSRQTVAVPTAPNAALPAPGDPVVPQPTPPVAPIAPFPTERTTAVREDTQSSKPTFLSTLTPKKTTPLEGAVPAADTPATGPQLPAPGVPVIAEVKAVVPIPQPPSDWRSSWGTVSPATGTAAPSVETTKPVVLSETPKPVVQVETTKPVAQVETPKSVAPVETSKPVAVAQLPVPATVSTHPKPAVFFPSTKPADPATPEVKDLTTQRPTKESLIDAAVLDRAAQTVVSLGPPKPRTTLLSMIVTTPTKTDAPVYTTPVAAPVKTGSPAPSWAVDPRDQNAFSGDSQPQPQEPTPGAVNAFSSSMPPSAPPQGMPYPPMMGQGMPYPPMMGQGMPNPAMMGQGMPYPPMMGQGMPNPAMMGQGMPYPPMMGQGMPYPPMMGQGMPYPPMMGQGMPYPPMAQGMPMQRIPIDQGIPQGMGNAFTLSGGSTRPVPADFGPQEVVPNAFMDPTLGNTMPTPPPAAPRMMLPILPAQPYVAPQAEVLATMTARRGLPPVGDPTTAQTVAKLRDALYPSHREMAVEQLAGCDWHSQPAVLSAVLMAAKEDPAGSVRAACVRTLTRMKAATPDVIAVLIALKTDTDERVRREVDRSLSLLGVGLVVGDSTVRPASATRTGP